MIDSKDDKKPSPDGSLDSTLKFYVRKMHYQGSLMINICDEELIGTNIVSESLNINITKDFFIQSSWFDTGFLYSIAFFEEFFKFLYNLVNSFAIY